MKIHSRYNAARKILIFWCLFIGIGAVFGAACMLIKPDGSLMGMQGLLPYFQVMPLADLLYQNFIFPGIALLCINGIPNLVAAGLLFAGKKAGLVCGTVFGLTLMAWIVIQFVIFPSNVMSNLYFNFGILQMLTGCAALIFYQQEQFTIHMGKYPNIGTNPSRLVVYFSRMGYTKKLALEEANRTGAAVYEVKSTERTAGTTGFWWCGRFGMHGWDMPIEEMKIDLATYEHVTVCSPVWVFRLAAPMRSFCRAAKGSVKETDYILTHFNPCKYYGVATEMDALMDVNAMKVESICVQWGRVKKRDEIRKAETNSFTKHT